MSTPELETARLILRQFTPDDLPALYELFLDRDVNRFLPWFPVNSLAEAREFCRKRYGGPCTSGEYHYAICRKAEGTPIGYIDVGPEESRDFGYGLRKEYWCQGLVTEAGQAVIRQLRADGVPYITATHDVKNPRSGAVMKRLGMKYCYSYEERWMPKDVIVTFRMYQLNLDGDRGRVYQGYWNRAAVRWVEAAAAL